MSIAKVTKSALIIRFNSIGDIVLTSPVIDALNAHGYEVHYLVKASFKDMLIHDKKIKKVWTLGDHLDEVISELKKESFSVVIDLHNNFRSKKVKRALGAKSLTLAKNRWQLWKLTQTPFKSHREKPIVHRFLDVIKPLGIDVASPKTRMVLDGVSLPSSIELPSEPYLVIAVGAAWHTKRIPVETLIYICQQCQCEHIVLIGDKHDQATAEKIQAQTQRQLVNLTGQLSINQSALVISKAAVVLSGDTGPMHMAAALEVPVVGVFGSTHPALGYTPYYGDSTVTFQLVQNENLQCRPCTKQGKKQCPKGHFKCMLDLDSDEIVNKVNSYFA